MVAVTISQTQHMILNTTCSQYLSLLFEQIQEVLCFRENEHDHLYSGLLQPSLILHH